VWEFRPLVQENGALRWKILQTLAKELRAADGHVPIRMADGSIR
jgi:hypothetical protein